MPSSVDSLTGGAMRRVATCCCGGSSIEVLGEPTLNAICHCNNCKQRTGAAFGWNVYFPDEQILEIRGDLSEYRIRDEQVRSYCSKCGTTLFWKSSFMPNQTGIAGGAIVGPHLHDPTVSAADHKRVAWIGLPDTVNLMP
jgi:hypothetical protein